VFFKESDGAKLLQSMQVPSKFPLAYAAYLQPKKHLSKRTWEFVEKISMDQNVGGTLQKSMAYRIWIPHYQWKKSTGSIGKYIFSQGPFTISMEPPPPGLLVKAKLCEKRRRDSLSEFLSPASAK